MRVGFLKEMALGTWKKALISLLRTLLGSSGLVPLELVTGMFKYLLDAGIVLDH